MGALRLLLVALALYVSCVACASMPRKKLAGPPEDFDLHDMPDPEEGTISSNSAMVSVDLDGPSSSRVGAEYSWSAQLPCDADNSLVLTFLSPVEGLVLALTDPSGNQVPLASLATPTTFPLDTIEVPATSYTIPNPINGVYKVEVTGSDDVIKASDLAALATSDPDAFIMWFNDNYDVVLNTQLTTYSLTVGSDMGVAAYVSDAPSNRLGARMFADSIASAEMTITFPNGSEYTENMHDDGLHADADPNDGIYGAVFVPTRTGSYTMQSTLCGKTGDSVFIRSTQHLVTVVQDNAEYTGQATATVSADTITVSLELTSPPAATYKAYAEVWSGDVSVCWIGGVVDVTGTTATQVVQLEIDVQWLVLAGLTTSSPLSLRNVRLQDLETSIPVSLHDDIPVQIPAAHAATLQRVLLSTPVPAFITEKMRVGARPLLFTPEYVSNSTGQVGSTVFLHGYCSKTNPWSESGYAFADPYFFLNPGASVSHDTFANLVNTFATANNLQSYSLVAHSQGGPVSVHLGNYYWSGLDTTLPSQGRIIQSVGSPYQGCSGAGSLAGIGKLFGIACGTNHDLTVDGSKLWLAGISLYFRQKTYFYTTTYKRNQFFGDYCNLPINSVLNWPNDGTSELTRTVLPGAYNVGNTEQWCHTTGMKYKPQCSDPKRNAEINKNAAR
eukprot:TRINITY_DN192_c0_g1_i3.p1 TRINITY_DN192_c0_g1~~TRINITY_DN192_c0_g1_i3.p1  ORF type:complete len:671 (-),score=219.98 TRINITY_DN192_c0_g1_i3:86-2098(-)